MIRPPSFDDQPWRAQAACKGRDVSIFFNTFSNIDAYRVCATCRVREECLQFAVSDPTLFGVWGGTSERERARLRRRRPSYVQYARRRAV